GPASPGVALSLGALGSAGALVEATVTGGGVECRTLWRYRDGRLTRVPLLGASGPVPDCAPPDWKYRWERPAEDAPALLMRERSRKRANGVFREVEAFRYAGFRMEPDTGRFASSINDIEIPGWRDVTLYPRELPDRLAERSDLALFRTEPRVRLFADRAEGIFELRVEDASRTRGFPVTTARPGDSKSDVLLTVGTEGARIRVLVSADGAIPLEVTVQGLDARLDLAYVPVTRVKASGLRVYDSAEQELAEEFLPGTWDDGKARMAVALEAAVPLRLRFGKAEAALSLALAPPGVDALLLPADGSSPTLGILLKGPNSYVEMPVRCTTSGQPATRSCESRGPGRTLRRVGARLNVR
ncbi:MAG TPA: hypothetical protein VIZ58_03735, partial [Thermoanaerobaculia bacterium]